MPVHNAEIARMFNEMADLLDFQAANPFRVRAYRNAARTVAALPRQAADMLTAHEDLSQIPCIGKDLAGKIQQIVNQGSLPALEEAKRQTPGRLSEMLTLGGLGPKRLRLIYDQLGVRDIDGLADAARQHRLQSLRGLGARIEESLLRQIEKRQHREQRIGRAEAMPIVESVLAFLRKTPGVQQAAIAGSYRRQCETVGDLDVIATCNREAAVTSQFVRFDEVDHVLSQGETRASIQLRCGMQIDLRVMPDSCFGAALLYFTGSKAHNIALRKRGVDRGLKINEYGVFQGLRRIAGRTELEVYRQVGLPYIEPELRENRGEIEAAIEGRLPQLVQIGDIRGDLHSHTTATDGKLSLAVIAETARKLGYQYLAITDHSKSIAMAHGLDEARLRQQMKAIDELNDRLDGLRLLKSCEVDILADGSLDLDDDVLKELDMTVCSVHSRFNLSREKQTERIIRAMDNPWCTIIGHPTGRLIGRRDPYAVDVQRLVEAAAERGCILELNAQPDRLDLSDLHCRLAKEHGVKIAVSTDAHHAMDFQFMSFGIGQARRGWLEQNDVVNTRSLSDLFQFLRRS